MAKRRISRTIYQCDGPKCEIETENEGALDRWIVIHMHGDKSGAYFHRTECAIAYLSDRSNGFDAAIIRAHIGEPVPAGAPKP